MNLNLKLGILNYYLLVFKNQGKTSNEFKYLFSNISK
jgi:hypothetical protein